MDIPNRQLCGFLALELQKTSVLNLSNSYPYINILGTIYLRNIVYIIIERQNSAQIAEMNPEP